MERVLRSAFDPLPRSLSTTSLAFLVAVVLLGTSVTVIRYLESSEPTERKPVPAECRDASNIRPAEVQAASSEASMSATPKGRGTFTPVDLAPTVGTAPASSEGSGTAASNPSPASCFHPEGESSGS